ncbi:hypothetical protein H3H36_23300 [Duganella sp. FT3S]|uniref:Uncharacterized protein n=1 Tax=Rugamonas fusca TaxID=2758568 RepID=A0A7W2ELS6_9BURK|nr:hypothetical protein [Rugamonas fusca]MBA5608280.1 hypothetical protein [Rugamonas fusca]
MTDKSSRRNVDEGTYTQFLYYWFRHLQMNADYHQYCAARRNGDTATCTKLEAQFDKIALIYNDWGDIYFFIDGTPINGEEGWAKWLETHIHLFWLRDPKAEAISNPLSHNILPGHLLIDVSLTQHKSDVLKMLKDLIDQHYDESKVEGAQLARYPLHNPHGKLNKAALVGVKKAFFVGLVTENGKNDKQRYGRKKWGHYDTALTICEAENHDLGGFSFNWTLTEAQKQAAESDDVNLMELGIDDRVKQVRDYLNIFEAHVRNTIHGKFPCKDCF